MSQIFEGVRENYLEATLVFVDFSHTFHSIKRENLEQILLAYCLPPKNCYSYNDVIKTRKAMVCSPYGDTVFFDIFAEVLQRDSFTTYLFIIWPDYDL